MFVFVFAIDEHDMRQNRSVLCILPSGPLILGSGVVPMIPGMRMKNGSILLCTVTRSHLLKQLLYDTMLFCPAQELEDLRRKYMTKKGPVQKVMGQMRLLSNEDKASAAAACTYVYNVFVCLVVYQMWCGVVAHPRYDIALVATN